MAINLAAAAGAIVVLCFVASISGAKSAAIYNVVDNGAVGDGRTDDAKAFLATWGKACADATNPTFLVPSGKTGFLLSQLTFEGPCKSNVHVQISGDLVGLGTLWTSKEDTWISFHGVNGLTVDGNGLIDGKGSAFWECKAKKQCQAAPDIMAFASVNDLRLNGLKFKDSPGKHVTLYECVGVNIDGISVTAPEDSPNTDGLLISKSQHVKVVAATFSTGDDCIAILSGSSDISITQITCGPGHGISIGSLQGPDVAVEQIRVSASNFMNTMNGVRIKSWQGVAGYAKDIIFEHINLTSVRNPIIINQFYCPNSVCANKTTDLEMSNVQFLDIHGSSMTEVAVDLACNKDKPCQDIILKDININVAGKTPKSYCLNAVGRSIGQVIPPVPCLGS